MGRSSVVSRIAHDACDRAPPMPHGPRWWDELTPDFAHQPEGFQLEARDQWWVSTTAASDIVLRTLGACFIGSLALPLRYNPFHLRRTIEENRFYLQFVDNQDPDRFFRPPPYPVPIRRQRARWPRFRPKDGMCEDLTFKSPFTPINPMVRHDYLRHQANRVAHGRLWRHHRGPRPTILAIHGFSADLYWLNEWFFEIPQLYAMGCDVLLVTLPFHGPRQTRFSPMSGHGFFAGGVSRVNEAMAQMACDVRVFLDYLTREQGVAQVGLTGVSLGGLCTALMAAVEPRLAFAIPNVPVTSLSDLILEWKPINLAIRAVMKTGGLNVCDLRRLFSVSSPLTFPPKLPKERLMIIGGVGDRMAPPKHSRLLWDHWQRCRIHWFPGSHLIHLDRGTYLREIERFLREIAFLEGPT